MPETAIRDGDGIARHDSSLYASATHSTEISRGPILCLCGLGSDLAVLQMRVLDHVAGRQLQASRAFPIRF